MKYILAHSIKNTTCGTDNAANDFAGMEKEKEYSKEIDKNWITINTIYDCPLVCNLCFCISLFRDHNKSLPE